MAALTRLPGIGKKTAERIVVELREKIIGVVPETGDQASALSQSADDAVSALQALGYARIAAEKAVNAAIKADPSITDSTEAIIRAALKQ